MVRHDFSGLLRRFDEAEIRHLAGRFDGAGGRRIALTADTARLVAQALRSYADMLVIRAQSDESLASFRLVESTGKEGVPWPVALCSSYSVAQASFAAATAESPHRTIRLFHGARQIAEHVPAPQGEPNAAK